MDDHSSLLTIDLTALRANWRALAQRGMAGECGAVIKADAYGLGIETAAPALREAGCRTFFVAHLSEAIRARAVLPDAVIYVLNGLAEKRLADYRAHRLRPVLGARHELDFWAKNGVGAEPAALHIDTAMNRHGLRPEAALDLLATSRLADLGVSMVMSHFASAEIEGDATTQAQIATFAALVSLMRKAGSPNAETRTSLCNSSGLFVPDARGFDLARSGYALYGGNPTPGRSNPMRAVIRLEAPIIDIRAVPTGEAVGYNGNWRAKKPSRIAVLSCGYADGYPRNAGNNPGHAGGAAIIAGVECPFAGNVSMDLITVDVTELPENAAKPGDPATLIGDTLDVDRVGAAGKTIGYEILTNLGKRYRRVARG